MSYLSICKRWHLFAVKNFFKINLFLVVISISAIYMSRNLKINPSWITLFAKNDSVIVNYEKYFHDESSICNLFIKCQFKSDVELLQTSLQLKQLKYITEIVPVWQENDMVWLKVKLSKKVFSNISLQTIAVKELEDKLHSLHLKYKITGALKIMQDFNKSIKNDFVFSTCLALLLVVVIIILVYGFSGTVIYGFYIEVVGFIIGIAIYRLFYSEINILTATIPCVLLGLGIDFVIHSVTNSQNQDVDTDCGVGIYRTVAIPMFWGALTTAVAFFSLCFTKLPGLRSAGLLGGILLLTIYFAIILLLPAAISRFKTKRTFVLSSIRPPFIDSKYKKVFLKVGLIGIAVTAVFIPRIKFDMKMDNLYDTTILSLKAQQLLVADLGFHFSSLVVQFKSNSVKKDLQFLAQNNKYFRLLDMPMVRDGVISCKFSSIKDPFLPQNYKSLYNFFQKNISKEGGESLQIIGEPEICQHLNELLVQGVVQAVIIVIVFIFLVLLAMYRTVLSAVSVITVLLLTVVATLGVFAICNFRFNLYTIILFPLFLGIGVDDCMHIVHLYHNRIAGSLKIRQSVFQAVILTTITTVVGYGSLCFAHNQGFRSMGIVAVVGLIIACVLALYTLPLFLNIQKRSDNDEKNY